MDSSDADSSIISVPLILDLFLWTSPRSHESMQTNRNNRTGPAGTGPRLVRKSVVDKLSSSLQDLTHDLNTLSILPFVPKDVEHPVIQERCLPPWPLRGSKRSRLLVQQSDALQTDFR